MDANGIGADGICLVVPDLCGDHAPCHNTRDRRGRSSTSDKPTCDMGLKLGVGLPSLPSAVVIVSSSSPSWSRSPTKFNSEDGQGQDHQYLEHDDRHVKQRAIEASTSLRPQGFPRSPQCPTSRFADIGPVSFLTARQWLSVHDAPRRPDQAVHTGPPKSTDPPSVPRRFTSGDRKSSARRFDHALLGRWV